jgi:glycosyltransferase involved in cell wall biosynthesis
MKLLILTQKTDINDDVLGFFHTWLVKFAEKCEKLIVICLEKGEYNLPENVGVLSLGKEKGVSRLKYLISFYKYIWQKRKNYDAVFVHMNPIYAALGGWLWRLLGKKIILWYTHRQVDFKLKIAEKFADVILTASKESFRLKSGKIKILGHGIDTEKFIPAVAQQSEGKFKIVYVGRISKIKNQELLIKAVDYLVNSKNIRDIKIEFIGSPVYPKDKKYFDYLRGLIRTKNLADYINFGGSVPYKEIINIYHSADLSVNLCPTGGLDKAVLESMSCGLPVIVLNKSFESILGDYKNELVLREANAEKLAQKILAVKNCDEGERRSVSREIRGMVVREHSLGSLIDKIIGHCQ